jgi:hypothetical protein
MIPQSRQSVPAFSVTGIVQWKFKRQISRRTDAEHGPTSSCDFPDDHPQLQNAMDRQSIDIENSNPPAATKRGDHIAD